MGTAYVVEPLSGGVHTQTTINNNFTAIQTALGRMLSVFGDTTYGDNTMRIDLDMDSNDILNGGNAAFADITIAGVSLMTNVNAAAASAAAALVSENNAATSETNAAASAASAAAYALPLPETSGGTNQTAYATGDILYASATDTLSKLPISTDGYHLVIASGIPAWVAISSFDIWGNISGAGFWAATPSTVGTPATVGGTGTNQLAIGDGAVVNGTTAQSIAIGRAYASGTGTLAIGTGYTTSLYGATTSYAIAIGYLAKASGGYALAVGQTCTASGTNSTSVGYSTQATNTAASAYGYNAKAQNTNTTAIGSSSQASTASSQAFGASVVSSGTGAISLGYGFTNASANTIQISRAGSNGLTIASAGQTSLQGTSAQYVLPNYATGSLPSGTTGGLVYDTTTGTPKYYNAGWVAIGVSFADATTVSSNTPALATNYQNSHSTPMFVSARAVVNSGSGTLTLLVGPDTGSYVEVCWGNSNYSPDTMYVTVNGVVPPGWYWKVTGGPTPDGGSILY